VDLMAVDEAFLDMRMSDNPIVVDVSGDQMTWTNGETSFRFVANCDEFDRVPPESMAEDLSSWLGQTQSERGEVPEDLEVTIVDAVGQDGTWVLVASFSERFEAGVFAIDEAGDVRVLWGGAAATETEIRETITSTVPDLPRQLPMCVDVSGFVES
ncbi:MAG: hypothetical protein ACLFWH_15765, partial [Actinomycetota bacterium]